MEGANYQLVCAGSYILKSMNYSHRSVCWLTVCLSAFTSLQLQAVVAKHNTAQTQWRHAESPRDTTSSNISCMIFTWRYYKNDPKTLFLFSAKAADCTASCHQSRAAIVGVKEIKMLLHEFVFNSYSIGCVGKWQLWGILGSEFSVSACCYHSNHKPSRHAFIDDADAGCFAGGGGDWRHTAFFFVCLFVCFCPWS